MKTEAVIFFRNASMYLLEHLVHNRKDNPSHQCGEGLRPNLCNNGDHSVGVGRFGKPIFAVILILTCWIRSYTSY
jgi:hypothetical protein